MSLLESFSSSSSQGANLYPMTASLHQVAHTQTHNELLDTPHTHTHTKADTHTHTHTQKHTHTDRHKNTHTDSPTHESTYTHESARAGTSTQPHSHTDQRIGYHRFLIQGEADTPKAVSQRVTIGISSSLPSSVEKPTTNNCDLP